MPSKLPNGWVQTSLREICLNVASIRPEDSPDTEFTYFDIGGIDNRSNRIIETKSFFGREAPSRARQSVRKDDVLFSTVRTYLKKIARIEYDYPNPVASTGFAVIRAAGGVSPKFLFLQVLSEDFLQPIHALQSGSSYPAVREKDVFAQPIRLAPTREQERIVAKLEALLSRLAAGEAAARRALARLQRYRTVVLHAAVTGELTRGWRRTETPNESGAQLLKRLVAERRARWEEAELKRLLAAGAPPANDKWKKRYSTPVEPDASELPSMPKTWTIASADQLTDATRAITYGVIKLGAPVAGGVPVLRSSNVRRLELDLHSVKQVSRTIADAYERTYLKGGEVLVTVRGTLGGVIAVPPDCAGYNISREVAMLALLAPESAPTVADFIASDLLQQWLTKRAKGIAYTGINIETLRQLPVPLPPLEEQKQIAQKVEQRLKRAAELELTLEHQLARANAMRQSLLHEAFSGNLVPQDPTDESASVLLERIEAERGMEQLERKEVRRRIRTPPKKNNTAMQPTPSAEALKAAWFKIGQKPDAKRLFTTAGFATEQVVSFYEQLRLDPEIREAFESTKKGRLRVPQHVLEATRPPKKELKPGQFRLVALWLENFKNLKDYHVRLDPAYGLDVVLGWNGTGKSNLFEALVIIFRDLHYWSERNKWPSEPMAAYRLVYEIEGHVVDINWNATQMKRPTLTQAALTKRKGNTLEFTPVRREDLRLPKFVFGYYSGPTNRLAEHFLPMKRDHYDRLRTAKSDDAETLTRLLEQRRFFCAETHHAKYVLLAFAYKEDEKITRFLEKRLRILSFESALFVIRRPRWARKGSSPENFWGATGIMLRVMEKLRRFAIAPMVLQQVVSDGYRSAKEDHYFFFLPDLKSLHAFAGEYADARSFFLALESTDFSELIHDAKIQVRVKASDDGQLPITFRELSEGEQQLLMVLGLMRFTKSHQSLVLLDEPDTHLNPHWSVEYLKDLASVISDNDRPSPEQQTSQLLMATHDPLVIASLVKEQVHLLKRDRDSLRCYWRQADENPRGLGYTGILLSDMFGFRSDLDEETLSLLDRQVWLAAKPERLTAAEKDELTKLNKQIEALGFKTVSSDPYYRAFIEALARSQRTLELIRTPVQTGDERAEIRKAADKILVDLAQKHAAHL